MEPATLYLPGRKRRTNGHYRRAERSGGRRIAPPAPLSPAQGTPAPLRRREQAKALRTFGPALVGLLTAFAGFGQIAPAIAFALIVGYGARNLSRFRYPLAMMPASRTMLAVAPPLGAAGAIAALAALEPGYLIASPVAALLPGLLTAAAALLADRTAARWTMGRPVRIAVIGSPTFAVGLDRELRETGVRDFQFVGWINAGAELSHPADDGHGSAASIRAAIERHGIDLIVKGNASGREELAFGGRRVYSRVAEACLDMPVRMIDGNQFYEQTFGHVPIGTMDAAWYLFIKHPRFRHTPASLKRLMDLAAAAAVGVLALPLIGLAALAIKLTDRGPVFFRQRRIGERGETFEILKLRTMRVQQADADARWAGADDDRVTRVGAVLRRTHIDELPQLLNVFAGEMTLVGPRPEQPEIVAELERALPHYNRRHLVKPGVTGWAQVRCGYAGTMLGTAWKACHDLYYLKHSSLLADLLIMLETMVIAAKDSHRPLRAPESQFLVARDLGIDLSEEAEVYTPQPVDLPDKVPGQLPKVAAV